MYLIEEMQDLCSKGYIVRVDLKPTITFLVYVNCYMVIKKEYERMVGHGGEGIRLERLSIYNSKMNIFKGNEELEHV